MMTTPGEILGTVVPIAILIGVLIWMQRFEVEDLGVGAGTMALPGILAMSALFSAVMGIVSLLALDRTNGTLLRSKSVPRGTTGYLVGEITANAMVTLLSTVLVLAVGLMIFDDLVFDTPWRWALFTAVTLLGLVAMLAIGAVLGALMNNPKYMGLVMMPMMGLIAVSGIFFPLAVMPAWLQAVAQAFPLYWFGLGMRASLLPDSMASVEVAGSWRIEWVFIVLAAWAVAGLVLAPKLLGRMARRESGSTLAARRQSMHEVMGV
ncbi:ABC transporter permease [Leucobacter chromiisoli]|uniref:ABC transporter permease n=1 Tax=Leucobacter chromiisoli TaxID=2796471 RepID=UPI0027DE969A|nr:ABC transporter permease [Leucobacter chromiisoli]